MTKKNYKTVELPDLEIFTKEKGAGIMAFYKTLGFDNDVHNSLDPTKVILNTKDHSNAIDKFKSIFKGDDVTGSMLLFMNKGPSGDNSVKEGFVKLVDGWVK